MPARIKKARKGRFFFRKDLIIVIYIWF